MFSQHLAPSAKNLQGLFVLRNIEVAGQLLAMLIAAEVFDIRLPLAAMLGVSACLLLLNGLTWWRLKQAWPVTDAEFAGQLLLDLLALTLLLFLSGGSTNPFVSLLLLPLTLAAATLPPRYTWSMAAAALASYSYLLFYYLPLSTRALDLASIASYCGLPGGSMAPAAPEHLDNLSGQGGDFGLHVLGMWFNFLVSAGLIAFFVSRMASSLRERDRLLAATREEALRNERIIALGTLAAGAAHELGTPLGTMAVVLQELQHEHKEDAELTENLRLLRAQVDTCKSTLTKLVASSGEARPEGGSAQALDAYLAELLEQWQLIRPQVGVQAQWHGPQPAPRILAEQTLSQAIMNLWNNAADVSPQGVEVEGRWDALSLTIEIRDRGPGVTPEMASKAGQAFFTTKGPAHGLGLGLFLANATIERFGGKVSMFNREGGGACVQVNLPLHKLIMKD